MSVGGGAAESLPLVGAGGDVGGSASEMPVDGDWLSSRSTPQNAHNRPGGRERLEGSVD